MEDDLCIVGSVLTEGRPDEHTRTDAPICLAMGRPSQGWPQWSDAGIGVETLYGL